MAHSLSRARLALLTILAAGALLGAWRESARAGTTRPLPVPAWPVDATLSTRARSLLTDELTRLDGALAQLESPSARDRATADETARRAFKRVEGLLAAYAPDAMTGLDGSEMETGDDNPDAGRVVSHGFARLARIPAGSRAAHEELARMRAHIRHLLPLARSLTLGHAFALEIARLELARVATLGIAGVGAARPSDAIRECADALDGVAALIITRRPEGDRVRLRLADASGYLRAHPDFVRFDRYEFVTRHAGPAFDAIAAARRLDPGPSATLRRAWPASVASIYDAAGFDPNAFGEPDAPGATPEWIALGEHLFNDPAMSPSGTRSCASCHAPSLGFTDGLTRATPLPSVHHVTLRHTPRIGFAGLQAAQFADARAATLERQIDSVLASPAEMGGSIAAAVAHVRASSTVIRLAERASGKRGALGITPWVMRSAVATYVRSLARFDSPFDRAMRGDDGALSPAARHGFNLFMGRAQCGTCHFAPLFSGTTPPDFTVSAVEVIGVPAHGTHGAPDADAGVGAITRLAGHDHAFRTPTVRDAALGGPYMHDGALRSLDDVLDFYDRGGAHPRLPNATLDAEPLHLSADERQALLAFLHALVSPSHAPSPR